MPRVSVKKRDKIAEQIIHQLFEIAPAALFTSEIAESIARDEEFTKAILLELVKKKVAVLISKNSAGKSYLKRRRWRLSNEAYEIYKQRQSTQVQHSIDDTPDEQLR